MGDRTPIEATVYSCPPERVNAVLDVFEEFVLGNEFGVPGAPVPGPSGQRSLELGRGYIHSDISVGSGAEIAAALPAEAAWKVWEELLTAPARPVSRRVGRAVQEGLAGGWRCPPIPGR